MKSSHLILAVIVILILVTGPPIQATVEHQVTPEYESLPGRRMTRGLGPGLPAGTGTECPNPIGSHRHSLF